MIASHLAVALAAKGSTALCDLDLEHADLSDLFHADRGRSSLLELVRVRHELSLAAVKSVAFEHPSAMRLITASGKPGDSALNKIPEIAETILAVASLYDVVVTDLPSGNSELAVSLIEQSARGLVIVTPDVLSIRRSRDALALLKSAGLAEEKITVLINKYRAGGIKPTDIQTILGVSSVLVQRWDRSLAVAAERGEISVRGVRAVARNLSPIL